jgi:hypothetical protein
MSSGRKTKRPKGKKAPLLGFVRAFFFGTTRVNTPAGHRLPKRGRRGKDSGIKGVSRQVLSCLQGGKWDDRLS